MNLRWFFSRQIRHASDFARRVRKVLNAQRDLLPPVGIDALHAGLDRLDSAMREGDEKKIAAASQELEGIANKWLKPYPHPAARENLDVILVALVVALGIRTFFWQPMAIPTGSMQPTLYGIMPNKPTYHANLEIPSFPKRVFDSVVRGISYYHVVAENDGRFLGFSNIQTLLPFVRRQYMRVGDQIYTIWFPPDNLEDRVHLQPGELVRRGEDLIKLKVVSGDRLFVNRFTYNFRRPQRGEIVIFASKGIPLLTPNTHYIKRLIAVGNEEVRILNDQHCEVNGVRLDASTPHFEYIYSFRGPPRENEYSGHVNELVAATVGRIGIAPLFPNEDRVFTVRPDHYFVLGDNTLNSHDSRSWGDFPREKVIGKFSFVFWPISSRFGWGVR